MLALCQPLYLLLFIHILYKFQVILTCYLNWWAKLITCKCIENILCSYLLIINFIKWENWVIIYGNQTRIREWRTRIRHLWYVIYWLTGQRQFCTVCWVLFMKKFKNVECTARDMFSLFHFILTWECMELFLVLLDGGSQTATDCRPALILRTGNI